MICLDQMGPESAKSFPGQQLVHTVSATEQQPPAERARQEIDYGRRGKGYIFVDAWGPQEAEPVYTILDNLNVHRATDVLLFSLAHPRWEFVFQPTYAAYLNLIEPWWKVLRSLALKGRRFETWEQVCQAIAAATAYWNAHRQPFVWGRRRRHRSRRQAGIAVLPKVA